MLVAGLVAVAWFAANTINALEPHDGQPDGVGPAMVVELIDPPVRPETGQPLGSPEDISQMNAIYGALLADIGRRETIKQITSLAAVAAAWAGGPVTGIIAYLVYIAKLFIDAFTTKLPPPPPPFPYAAIGLPYRPDLAEYGPNTATFMIPSPDNALAAVAFSSGDLSSLFRGEGSYESCRRAGMLCWRPYDLTTPFSEFLYSAMPHLLDYEAQLIRDTPHDYQLPDGVWVRWRELLRFAVNQSVASSGSLVAASGAGAGALAAVSGADVGFEAAVSGASFDSGLFGGNAAAIYVLQARRLAAWRELTLPFIVEWRVGDNGCCSKLEPGELVYSSRKIGAYLSMQYNLEGSEQNKMFQFNGIRMLCHGIQGAPDLVGSSEPGIRSTWHESTDHGLDVELPFCSSRVHDRCRVKNHGGDWRLHRTPAGVGFPGAWRLVDEPARDDPRLPTNIRRSLPGAIDPQGNVATRGAGGANAIRLVPSRETVERFGLPEPNLTPDGTNDPEKKFWFECWARRGATVVHSGIFTSIFGNSHAAVAKALTDGKVAWNPLRQDLVLRTWEPLAPDSEFVFERDVLQDIDGINARRAALGAGDLTDEDIQRLRVSQRGPEASISSAPFQFWNAF